MTYWIVRSRNGFSLAVGMLCAFVSMASAQYAGPAVDSTRGKGGAPSKAMDADYRDIRILPGDVISIAAFGLPELTTNTQTTTGTIAAGSTSPIGGLKVGARGEITVPYLGTVTLAGRTPSEAAVYLSEELKRAGILADPQVSVQMVDSPTRVVTVVGEVQRPEPVSAFGRLRLLDAISACGGLTPLASHVVTVRRQGEPEPIVVDLGVDPKTSNVGNIQLIAGDTVLVAKVGDVFVVGQVKNQEAIPLSGNMPITVMRAITMAGGLNFGAALSKARIIRTTADNRRIEISLDLKKIMFGKEQDVTLVCDDILLIPTNSFKETLAAGGAGVAATLLYGVSYASTAFK
jgi:polysaccharide export outer membrane protein